MSKNSATERSLLDFRPNISFVEPESVDEEPNPPAEPIVTLDTIKTEATTLIVDYQGVIDFCDQVQAQINNRATGVIIKLDNNQDAHVLSSLRRYFNDPNKNEISYDDYMDCINHLNTTGQENLSLVNSDDIESAANDPFRDQFGVIGYPSGLARPELQSANQSIAPVDIGSFQSDTLSTLFTMLTPKLEKFVTDKIKEIF